MQELGPHGGACAARSCDSARLHLCAGWAQWRRQDYAHQAAVEYSAAYERECYGAGRADGCVYWRDVYAHWICLGEPGAAGVDDGADDDGLSAAVLSDVGRGQSSSRS